MRRPEHTLPRKSKAELELVKFEDTILKVMGL